MNNLLPADRVKQLVQAWLLEDIPSFDYGGYVVGADIKCAHLYQKASGVLVGRPFVDEIFQSLGCEIKWNYDEGTYIPVGNGERVVVAVVKGPSCAILQGERVALNLMARASGIATRARRLCQIKISKKWQGSIAGTRKTTPGFRMVEKYAMLVGGVDGHRMDLSSMIMLKDNHIWSHGSITVAVQKAKQIGGFSLKVEVECQSLEEAREAIAAGADVVMLDNMTPEESSKCALTLKSDTHHVIVEVSGGLTEETVGDYMCASVDVLSLGSLSQSVMHVDFSLKIQSE